MVGNVTFWACLLLSVALFWLLPRRWRLPFIGIVSFAYLFSIDGAITGADGSLSASRILSRNRLTLIHLLGWTVLFYVVCRNLDSFGRWRRFVVPALVLSILGYLAYFKYVPILLAYLGGAPFAQKIIIPLGISYFSFKFIHYAIERSRGNIAPHGFGHFLAYIGLFPIFTAGPIERFDHFQSHQEQRFSRSHLIVGGTRIIHGLIKKFVVGGILLAGLRPWTAPELLANLDHLAFWNVWRFLIISYLIIYVDFSAYSDIAIGSSRLFGLTIMENFNWPVIAPNISNLWKRWHMSLANWCQSYIYMPTLGLTRQPYLAVLLTFLVIGVWHAGALNFVAWGLYHALGVSVYFAWSRYTRRKKWRFAQAGLLRYWGVPVTFLFMAGSFAFTLTYETGAPGELYSAIRILARAFGIALEA